MAMQRRRKKPGSQRNEEEVKKSETLKKVSTLKTKLLKCPDMSTETLHAPQIPDQLNAKPVQPSCAKDFGHLSNMKFTIPQPEYSSTAAEARTELVAGPAHQWEKSRGEQEGKTRPLGQ